VRQVIDIFGDPGKWNSPQPSPPDDVLGSTSMISTATTSHRAAVPASSSRPGGTSSPRSPGSRLARQDAQGEIETEALALPARDAAVIAYKQPVTKPEIETITRSQRDYVLHTLLQREPRRHRRRAATPGRPLLYGTDEGDSLKHFGSTTFRNCPSRGDR